MTCDAFIAAALGDETDRAHMQTVAAGLRAGLRLVSYVAATCEYPDPCHVRTLAYAVQPLTGMRWRVYDAAGVPPAAKVPALMELWCARLPRWSPEYAYEAFLKVAPFGESSQWVGLVLYQWLNRSWPNPVLPPTLDISSRA
ncbi:MAG: hypothetical protein VYE68_02775 [Acidobacteriota bacterium]|nr:hypothetical protein [Acidobacteriota bacterium]